MNLSAEQGIAMHSLNSHATGPGDLEPARADQILVVTIVGVDPVGGVGVSVVRGEALVATEGGVGADVATAVTAVVTSAEVAAATVKPVPSGHANPKPVRA